MAQSLSREWPGGRLVRETVHYKNVLISLCRPMTPQTLVVIRREAGTRFIVCADIRMGI